MYAPLLLKNPDVIEVSIAKYMFVLCVFLYMYLIRQSRTTQGCKQAFY